MITCICLILEEEEEITLLRALRVGGECQRPRLGDDQELIQFLHDSVDPNGMRLSGAEFFYLDRRLLVSIAGSIITYTVILVQTNHGLTSRARTDMMNKGT
ncbi:uncharacterized protein [Dermacentor andersoni]|uniref:uncharacterized protein n=1 Tax=Dermacentor andersoni TaxID=34620 RepID=UPI002416F486|nr:uncharacterized protein LOC129388115 isoform X2 [Dermacentor andersoni]